MKPPIILFCLGLALAASIDTPSAAVTKCFLSPDPAGPAVSTACEAPNVNSCEVKFADADKVGTEMKCSKTVVDAGKAIKNADGVYNCSYDECNNKGN
jgi:hypothetical protein